MSGCIQSLCALRPPCAYILSHRAKELTENTSNALGRKRLITLTLTLFNLCVLCVLRAHYSQGEIYLLTTYNLQLTTAHAFFTFFAGAAFVFVRLLSHILSLVASTCASVFLERTDFSFSVISSLLAYLSLCFISSQLFSPW